MKFLAIFAAVLAVSSAYAPIASWSLEDLSAAIEDPNTDPALIPYLINGLNNLMANIHAGGQQNTVLVSLPVSQQVSLEELSALHHDPATNPAYLPYIEAAIDNIMQEIFSGNDVATVNLYIPPMEVNVWSLQQLSEALSNPDLDPELEIYLQFALNNLMAQIFAGQSVTEIAVITPPGVVAVAPELPVLPEPVIVPEIVKPETLEPPTAVVQPPAPVVQPPQPQSPLVQIIVNVNAQESAPAPAPTPVPVSPVIVPEEPIEQPIIAVGPWGPIGQPSPVGVVDPIEQPIIAVGPWAH